MAASSNTDAKMELFSFSDAFNGCVFYEKYKNATFLKDQDNLRTILLRSDELEKRYKTLAPGASMAIQGMFLKPDVPLVVKKSKLLDESDVHKDSFTLRRLLGFVATYVYSNFKQTMWQGFYSVESERFGLTLDSNKALDCNTPNKNYYYQQNNYGAFEKSRAYFSAVSGAEYFYEYFDYYPFLFALLRFQQKQISEELLLVIANIRHNDTMKSMVIRCAEDQTNATNAARQIGFNFNEAIQKAPQSIKNFFNKNGNVYFY